MAGKQIVSTKERKNEVRRPTTSKCRQKNLAHTLPITKRKGVSVLSIAAVRDT